MWTYTGFKNTKGQWFKKKFIEYSESGYRLRLIKLPNIDKSMYSTEIVYPCASQNICWGVITSNLFLKLWVKKIFLIKMEN